MARIIGPKCHRTSRGYTLTELLVTSLLIGITTAVIGELVVLNTFAIWKTTNKSEAINATRWAIERISADVRKARCVGDHYASAVADLNQFPADNGNPLYSSSPPPGGWPWSGQPYLLSPQCLVLQLPVFFENTSNQADPRNGFPSMIPAQALNTGVPATNVENLETVIYQVTQDPLIPSEYMLQVVRLPGAPIYNYTGSSAPPYPIEQAASLAVNPPQTLVRGVVGPLVNGGSIPSVFSYYTTTTGGQPTLLPQTTPVSSSLVPSISGIAIDLEVKKPTGDSATTANLPYQETVATHAEAAMRYNRKVQLTNFVIPSP
jgi:prepilin-type N-terminal cleavage/methylation domain-containing protein